MRNLYIDFDGVIVDTLTKPYKKMKKIGIDINNQKEKQNYLSNGKNQFWRSRRECNHPQ